MKKGGSQHRLSNSSFKSMQKSMSDFRKIVDNPSLLSNRNKRTKPNKSKNPIVANVNIPMSMIRRPMSPTDRQAARA